MRHRAGDDTAILDWLQTFAGTIEYDDIPRIWAVRPREPGYPPGVGRTLRAAAAEAMAGAMRADARPATIAIR